MHTTHVERSIDPFMLHRLERMKHQYVTVQTMEQTVRGMLTSAQSDYLILHVNSVPRYIQLHDIARISSPERTS